MIASLLVKEGAIQLTSLSTNPYQESLDLLCFILEATRDQLRLSRSTDEVVQRDCEVFWSLIERRKKNEPLAYLLNEEVFWDRTFFVDKRVLIPRPETEFLIEHLFKNHQHFDQILDLCCGSGILGVTCGLHYKNAHITLADICHDTLEVSSINTKKHQVKAELIQANLLNSFKENSFDLIVCNPPYVTNRHKEIMTPDVLSFEPHLALFSENDGLQHIYLLLDQVQTILKDSGVLYLEVGIDQLNPILSYIQSKNITHTDTIYDFQNIPRILVFRRAHE
ncbi:MAG: peptide chain release factor N(5)-glutamine methyltransferase [Candidatus Cloacimonetes bacterium]|nr:peptide chain release factor N(5)-glutamine methyltransferase [Candidatus Cloacimonadota bacterium]